MIKDVTVLANDMRAKFDDDNAEGWLNDEAVVKNASLEEDDIDFESRRIEDKERL